MENIARLAAPDSECVKTPRAGSRSRPEKQEQESGDSANREGFKVSEVGKIPQPTPLEL